MPRFVLPASVLSTMALVIVFAWWMANGPQNPQGGGPAEKFNSLSYEAYRTGDSPLTNTFATEAEADQDLALLAPLTRAIRTYAAIEANYDIATLAEKHGIKLWQGIWLGGNRKQNEIEMDRAIALAHRYPNTIERLVVGNEVLLRRDLPPAELIADIDRVRAAVKQPVAYADVSDFWEQFPEIAPHVDIVMIHLLPYWEDKPTGIDHAVAYVGQVFRHFHALYPNKPITIGETGWPSRGRQRQGARPGRIEEARFLREFIALSHAEHFDYNFIEAFDQTWKYASEGVVGANWGLFRADRTEKIPLTGPLEPDPDWRGHVLFSLGCGLYLALMGMAAAVRPSAPYRPLHRSAICVAGMTLGAALGYAQAETAPILYDTHVRVAAIVNLSGQAILAVLAIMRIAGPLPAATRRTGSGASARVRNLLRGRILPAQGLFEDVAFLFLWTAIVDQALLVFDPRYRDFPTPSFAVPLAVTALRWRWGDFKGRRLSRDDIAAGSALAILAVAGFIQEGSQNGQSVLWNACALTLATPIFLIFTGQRQRRPSRRA